MNVAQALAMPGVHDAPGHEPSVTLTGALVCTLSFAYLVDQFDDATGIMLHVEGDTITQRLLQCAPAYGGSHVIFNGPCVISGTLARCVLPMFPRVLCSISLLSYDGSDIVRNGDSWVANPPFDD
ncbi:hypothetical protein [Rhodopirellula europaea]|uniref:hypothetical protein n=1 Tax=Rhodopirellula europaea TaxID=1263866 RepID=UPI003D2858DF